MKQQTMRAIWLLPFLLLVCPESSGAQVRSDVERLSSPLPTTFKRTKVLLYPAIDYAALSHQVDASGADRALERGFEAALQRFANLRLYPPGQVRAGVALRSGYSINRGEALQRARWGLEAYREVRLENAIKKLRSALKVLIEIEYDLENSEHMAKLTASLGQALLEAGQPMEATDAFKRALLLHPGHRLKKGFDRPEAVKAFDDVRRALIKAGDAPALRDLLAEASLKRARIRTSVRTYITPEKVVVVIRTPQGRQVETLNRTRSPEDDGNRLASRVFASLPFGLQAKVKQNRDFLFDLGLSSFTYASSPLGPFPHFGVQSTATLVLGSAFSLEGSLQLNSSARDHYEHLRENLTTVRGRLGLGGESTWSRLSLFGHLGIQADYQSEVVITTMVACKYFSPRDDVPTTLCDFDRDFDRSDATISVGGAMSMGFRVALTGPLSLVGRIDGAAYLLQSEDNGFGVPIGGSLSVAYQLW